MTPTEISLREKCAIGAAPSMTALLASLTEDELALLTTSNFGLLQPLPIGYARDRYHAKDPKGKILTVACPPAAMGQAYGSVSLSDREVLDHTVALEAQIGTGNWDGRV